jgi:hypothetical protein
MCATEVVKTKWNMIRELISGMSDLLAPLATQISHASPDNADIHHPRNFRNKSQGEKLYKACPCKKK